jgi:hypothetical protein
MIPKLIHFVWIGSPLPDWAARNIEEFRRLNPDHQVRLHGEEAAPKRFAAQYAAAEHPSTRSDLIRYELLAAQGGWYFDVDYWPVRPVADIERAYLLDGGRLFAAWMNNPRINNSVLACAPGCKALNELAAMIDAGGQKGRYGGRTAYGPPLITRLAAQRGDLVRTAAWPWFHGVRDVQAASIWRACLRGRTDCLLDLLGEHTGGQLPFAFHLWAHTHGEAIQMPSVADRPLLLVFGRSPKDEGPDRPYQALAAAGEKLGYRSQIVCWSDPPDKTMARLTDPPAVAVCWNGLKGKHADNATSAASMGATVIRLEHGFYDRNSHFQADHAGFLHRASWRTRLREPAPPGSAERLARFVPQGIRPQRLSRQGVVLVVGQVPGDSQMIDSEIAGPLPLQRAVKGSLPAGVKAVFRPHPQCGNRPFEKPILPLADDDKAGESAAYKRHKHGAGLAAALEQARFVVTINSNAIVEALIAGVPVLALGPSLAIDAGAALGTSLAGLPEAMRKMADGWRAPDAAVANYLRWLAARQWSVGEFADPAVLAMLLADAGVPETAAVGSGQSAVGGGPQT